MSTNWSNPSLSQLWADFVSAIKSRDESSAKMDYAGDTNLPTSVVRFNRSNNRLEEWNGTAWVALPIDLTNTTGALPAGQFTDTTHGSRTGGALHAGASGAAAGFMSSADKSKLDAAASTATASALMLRDANGRAKVAAPAASDDIAQKAQADAVQTNLSAHTGTSASGVHGSTSSPSANALIHRDANGRAQVASPSAAADIARKDYVDAAVAALTSWSTGDVKATFKTVADTGWVMLNDGTLGSASSGATTRANADAEALFTLLWNNITNAWCAVSSGRGASAAADFAANKTIALPKALGRLLGISGTGAGLTARALGENLGSENAIVVQHNHGITDPGHNHPVSDDNSTGGSAMPAMGGDGTAGAVFNTAPNTTGISINNTGSSGVGANMPPVGFLNVMIKL